MADLERYNPISVECNGAALPGENAPLDRRSRNAILVILKDGVPEDIYGCPHRINGRCITPGRTEQEAPACLYPSKRDPLEDTTQIEKVEGNENKIDEAVKQNAQESDQDGDQNLGLQLVKDSEEDLIPVISQGQDAGGYLVLSPNIPTIDLDSIDAVREFDRKTKLKAAVQLMLHRFEVALIGAGRPLSFSERLQGIHWIRALRDKSGERKMTIYKRLPNGRENEKFDFKYVYDKDGFLDHIAINFPEGTMYIDFYRNSINYISINAGDSNKRISSLSVLKAHGLEGSRVYNFVSKYPVALSERKGQYLADANVKIYPQHLQIFSNGTYYELSSNRYSIGMSTDLVYSSQENKFVVKDSTDGISNADFLAMLGNILGMLPFIRRSDTPELVKALP